MDPGQIFGDLRETDVARKIALKVIPHLQKANIEVQGVPLDLPLLQRLDWINNTGYDDATGDILIEIHINDGGKRGIEAWFEGEGENNSQKLAKTVVETVCAETGYANQGIHAEHEHELRSLTFLNRSKPAALLLETLYIDNPEDIAILKDEAKLEALAKSIASGIAKYLGKDLEGKELPAEKQPKYDDLKKVPRPAAPTLPDFGLDGLDGTDDLDDLFPMGGIPKPPTPPALPVQRPSSPSVSLSPGGTSLPGFSGLPGGLANPSRPGGNSMLDREQRKEMIKKNYLKILGREPSQSDMNYFLNQGTGEPELIQKMVDSQEHLDLVKAKKDLAETSKKLESAEAELAKLRAAERDSKEIATNLQALLAHKNAAIQKLETTIQAQTGLPSGVAVAQSNAGTPTSHSQTGTEVPKAVNTPIKRFYIFLSNLLNR